MTEADKSQNAVEVQQPSIPTGVDDHSEATESIGKASQEEISKSEQPEQSKVEKSLPDPEVAKERYKESNERRKREVTELRQRVAEQEALLARVEAEKQKYQHLVSNPPREGEIYDDYLGAYIPEDLSVTDYRAMQQAKMEEYRKAEEMNRTSHEYRRQEDEMLRGIEENLEAAKEKSPDIEDVLAKAASDGMIDVTMVKALADKSSGWNEDGLLFLAGLVKENPNALKDIMTRCKTDEAKAAAIGKLSAKYFDKPAARISNMGPPIDPINTKGNKVTNQVSLDDTRDAFLQRKKLYFANLKK